ncbi:hypothetical protein PWT90_04033 [Aphanocladium album]|nr:hypothetical protein PWT90_04033 [Aphanocladium album]
MTRNWLSIVLWTLLLSLLGFSDARTFQRRADDNAVSVVFRGDMRSPDQIRAAGGFFPRRAEEALGRELTATELEQGSSLYFHHVGATAKFTRYVSTTTDPKIARQFATPFRAAQQDALQDAGYVYRISADPKMVDVVGSLGRDNMMPAYVTQAEQAAVGGVPFDQIEGWYAARDLTDAKLAQLASGDKLEDLLTPNGGFADAKYTALRSSGAQPQLAGFGKRGKGVKARKTKPWSDFKDTSVQKHLDEFRVKVASDLKVPEAGAGAAAEEEATFVEADALGARDLVGALDVGEVQEGLTSVTLTEAGAAAELAAVTPELEAVEAAEAAEAIEALEAAEALAGLAEVSVLGDLLPWLLILA